MVRVAVRDCCVLHGQMKDAHIDPYATAEEAGAI
jgi:hypothetical protein